MQQLIAAGASPVVSACGESMPEKELLVCEASGRVRPALDVPRGVGRLETVGALSGSRYAMRACEQDAGRGQLTKSWHHRMHQHIEQLNVIAKLDTIAYYIPILSTMVLVTLSCRWS